MNVAHLMESTLEHAKSAASKRTLLTWKAGPAFTPEPALTPYQLASDIARQVVADGLALALTAGTDAEPTDGQRAFCSALAGRAIAALDPDALLAHVEDVAWTVACEMATSEHARHEHMRIARHAIVAYEAELHSPALVGDLRVGGR